MVHRSMLISALYSVYCLPCVLLEIRSTVVPLSFHHRFGKRRVVPSSYTRRAYENTLSGGNDNHQVSRRTCVEGEPTCLRYAREGGDLATLFGNFCRHCLCEESWEFIVEAVAYEVRSFPKAGALVILI